MKTFDEAIEKVCKKPDLFNLLDTEEFIYNEKWRDHIIMLTQQLVKDVAAIIGPNPASVLSIISSTLHIAFKYGVIVGMEMKKLKQ